MLWPGTLQSMIASCATIGLPLIRATSSPHLLQASGCCPALPGLPWPDLARLPVDAHSRLRCCWQLRGRTWRCWSRRLAGGCHRGCLHSAGLPGEPVRYTGCQPACVHRLATAITKETRRTTHREPDCCTAWTQTRCTAHRLDCQHTNRKMMLAENGKREVCQNAVAHHGLCNSVPEGRRLMQRRAIEVPLQKCGPQVECSTGCGSYARIQLCGSSAVASKSQECS